MERSNRKRTNDNPWNPPKQFEFSARPASADYRLQTELKMADFIG
jgi:hypothetical protein